MCKNGISFNFRSQIKQWFPNCGTLKQWFQTVVSNFGLLINLRRHLTFKNFNSKFRPNLVPSFGEDLFWGFWSSPEFGGYIAKFRAETEPVCGEDLVYLLSSPEYE